MKFKIKINATHLCHTPDYEKQADADADAGIATSELTPPAPPPYTRAKPVLYLPTRK